MRIESIAQFASLQEESRRRAADRRQQIMVCCGTGCLASGSKKVAEAFAEEVAKRGLDASVGMFVKTTGCHGFCERGPLVALLPSGILYTKVKPSNVGQIIDKTVLGGEVIPSLTYKNPADGQRISAYAEIPFYKHQLRVAMRNIGRIDPTDIRDAIAEGAYSGLAKALGEMTPEAVIEEVAIAGQRGRGGAGFNTARKWRSCRRAPGDRRFVLCNGDEGDPGAFKDRSIMEGDPHSVLEGMVIGAWAVGAHEGFIYVRDEYPLAVVHLTIAMEQARSYGLLGDNIMGSGFDFDIRISRGGGAFVCGESSALMRSLEGKIGEPRAKYVHSTDKGLFDLPTVLNNVETWAGIGAIIERGGAWFASMGTERSKGTKAFSLVGKVKNTGLIELPMGTTLRRIIFDIGGGILGDRPFKAVQTGGPSGGCVPEALLDLPVDYERLTEAGSMMGSGGMIVMDDRTCMVDVARYFLKFLTEESCGKCVPCREGLQQLLHIFDRLVEGRGRPDDIPAIERLSRGMQLGSLCELGKSAPNPVLSTLRYFRSEYEAHIFGKSCPAGICRELTAYEIVPDLCDGCHACFKACPVNAITGTIKELHRIHHDACISCGACFDVCPTAAIRTFPKVELKTEVV
ncbi:MAG TPA: NADH-ubiquinone oxidoreductase-F iron-sulfur binding region domain-containing protein [Thermoanaerobaculales bacterium]|nr:NADH-ubiquinone oxidoreductase-F iron-sulfur binding region domain-containing protein [Thermoanaerobaculales bacterium]HPA79521.1 NADH-ubiquinone oxidoreductase-F iron-sulfur binding region domain-containing protein [Thermoanaerobaculales bacterium]HQL30439.1 NADH-ubiquinone oxidoreductase-F iron-sulfur binding region domain-containing protein [Thermoanaerobaculales bacterium]HQN97343.1 NADH-ubiquinone oxidoreductase-F iron-sulfur binding region domain-containing protein [Thermoanaerobaculale